MVTREPEWDDSSRGRAMHLAVYASTICACGCGLPYAVSHDDKQTFIVDSDVCYAQRALTQVREAETKNHEDQPRWSVGRHHYVLPTDPKREEPA